MCSNVFCKQAVISGLFFWVLIFIEISVIGFTPGLASMSDHGFILHPPGIVIHLILVILITFFLGRAILKKQTSLPTIKTAVTLGITWLMVGTFLDVIITVPFFVKSYCIYFSKWALWVGYLLVLITLMSIARPRKT